MKRALLIIAHGSRRESANEEFRQQVSVIAAGVEHSPVLPAFLELAQPDIVSGIGHLVRDGARAIDVFPLFLNAGKHVSQDIPEQIEKARSQHPDLDIRLLDYLGQSPALPALVADLVRRQPRD